MMVCLVRPLYVILLCILVDSNQEIQQQSCGCHGRDGRDGRDGLSGRDGVKGEKGNQGSDGKKGEPGICDIKELTAIKSKLEDLTREAERLRNQSKATPRDQDCKQGLHFFEKFQEIPTRGAAAVKFFTIDDDLFLVFANHHGDNSGAQAKSVVYKMENKRFILIQTLSTHGARAIEHFKIDGVHYMAIANLFVASSVIYKWSTDKFEEFQVISTNYLSGFKVFTIEGDHYLAGTNSRVSSVYKWQQGRFVKYQVISSYGAEACDSIVIANETFLVYPDYYHAESKVYKWSGGHFVKFQSVKTPTTYSAKFFRVNGHVFLAFAHYYTGSERNRNSPIYKWDGVKFTLFQEVSTKGAIDIHPFEMNGEIFFAVSNYRGDGDGYSVRSVVYKASGAQFTLYQDLQTFGARGVHAIVHKGQGYLAFANYRKNNFNTNSFVYKFT